MLFRRRSETNIPEPKSSADLLHLIISYGDDVFPNLRISFQILSTIEYQLQVEKGLSAS